MGFQAGDEAGVSLAALTSGSTGRRWRLGRTLPAQSSRSVWEEPGQAAAGARGRWAVPAGGCGRLLL